jgi:hypothetical protein
MSKPQWFIIDDIEKFIESTRILVFDSFGETNEKKLDELAYTLDELDSDEIGELNLILSQEECKIIATEYLLKQKHKTKKTIRYLITDKKYMSMIESFNSRMISNLLNNLVNKGMLDTAYDAETNDFIFWVKEDAEETKKQKPETD